MMNKNLNYDCCITNLANSFLKYYGLKTYHNSITYVDNFLKNNQPKNIIMMVFDGLGSSILDKHLNENSFLKTHKFMDYSSVFPPTTVAATTAYLSGKNPIENGYLGWSIFLPVEDLIIDVFPLTNSINKEKLGFDYVKKYFSYTEIGEIIEKNNKASYHTFYPSFKENGYKNLEEIKDKLIELCKQPKDKFIYLYWDNPDYLMHSEGTNSKKVKEEILKIDTFVKYIYDNSQNTTIFVSADHGLVDTVPICLYTYYDLWSCLAKYPSIEGRAANFFIKKRKKTLFKKLFNQYFKGKFILLSRQDVLKNNLFGKGNPHYLVEKMLGDFLAVAISHYHFNFNINSFPFKATHAGLTKEELTIPLIICNN